MKAGFRKIPTILLTFRSFLCLSIFALSAVTIGLVDLVGSYRLIIESSTFESYQVFYHMGPAGFSAPDSVRSGELIKGPTPGRNFYSIAFPVPDKPIRNIRIDPGIEAGKILFRSIRLEADRFLTIHEWQARDIVRDFKPWNDIGEFSDKDGVLTIVSTGNDPYFLLPEEQTRMIFGETPPWIKIMTWIIKVLLILLFGFLVFYFSSEIEILIRKFLDVILFLIGRVIFYLKNLITFSMTGGHSFYQIVFVVVFLVLIFLPAIDEQFILLPQTASTEKRNLAKEPPLNLKQLSSYPEDYEKYFNDNFRLRNHLVRWNSLLNFKWLKISPNPLVVIGKNGWLFYGDDSSIRDYRGLLHYSHDDLTRIKQRLDNDTAILKRRGIHYLIVVSPNKDSIYPEFMPDNITRVKETRRLDQLKQYLQTNSSQVCLVDPGNALRKAKGIYPVYSKLDTHLNFYGGFTVYQEIVREISHRFHIAPLKFSDFLASVRSVDKANGDLAYYASMGGVLADVEVSLAPKSEIKPHLKISKLLIYHDSFFLHLRPYLTNDFNQIIAIHHDDAYINHQVIESEKPDVVIYEIAERNLHALLAGPR